MTTTASSPDTKPTDSSGADLGYDAGGRPVRGIVSLAVCAFLAVVTAVLYGSAMDGELVYDDLTLVDQSPATQSFGAAYDRAMEPLYAFSNPGAEVQRGLWRPLTTFTLAAGRTLSDVFAGDQPTASDRAFGFHLVSLLLHIAASCLLYRLAVRLIRSRAEVSAGRAECAGAAAALLFAVHPTQVESVAWISAVNDPLWASLALAALLRYDAAGARGKASFAAPILFFLALAAKEHAIVIAPLMLLLDLSARRRPKALAIAGIAVSLAAWYGLRVRVFDNFDGGIFRAAGDFGLSAARSMTLRLELLGGFVKAAVWPDAPAVFRPLRPVLPEGSNVVLNAALWSAGFAAVVAASLRFQRRAAALGGLAFLVVVLPFLITPETAGRFPLSDRYVYLAVGFAALTAAALLARMRSPLPLIAGAAVAAPCLALVSNGHIPTFESDLAFYEAAIEDAPGSANVRWGAGGAFAREYVGTEDVNALMRSYIEYLESLRCGFTYKNEAFASAEGLELHERMGRLEAMVNDPRPESRTPDPSQIWTLDDRLQATIGQIRSLLWLSELSKERDIDYPLEIAIQARTVWSKIPEVRAQLPDLDYVIAQARLAKGDYEGARKALGQAIVGRPGSAAFQREMGDILGVLGDADGARLAVQEALRLAPSDVELLVLHANHSMQAKRFELAAKSVKKAMALSKGRDKTVLVTQAELARNQGRLGDAMSWLDRALELDPDYGYAHKARGQAFLQMNDIGNAMTSFSEAARILTDDFGVHYQLAAIELAARPGPHASDSVVNDWKKRVQDVLIRAYLLSPPTGNEQLLIQQQLDQLVGDSPDAAFNLAVALKKQKRETLALYWLQRVTELGGNWPPKKQAKNLCYAFTEVGTIYLQLRRGADAEAAFREAIRLNPDHFRAQFELGTLLMELASKGERAFEEARLPLERARALFEEAPIAEDMREVVRATIEGGLKAIESQNSAGPAPAPTGDR